MAIGAQEYSVTIKLELVTKRDRRNIAELAWTIIQNAANDYGPDLRSGELMDITPVDNLPDPKASRLRRIK